MIRTMIFLNLVMIPLFGFSSIQARVVIKIDEAKLITPSFLLFSSYEEDVSKRLQEMCDGTTGCGVMPKYSFHYGLADALRGNNKTLTGNFHCVDKSTGLKVGTDHPIRAESYDSLDISCKNPELAYIAPKSSKNKDQ